MSLPGGVVFLCHLLSCSGEGSAEMSDGFVQDGVFSGRCVAEVRVRD